MCVNIFIYLSLSVRVRVWWWVSSWAPLSILKMCILPWIVDKLPEFFASLVWPYPDGAQQRWRGAPRRRAPEIRHPMSLRQPVWTLRVPAYGCMCVCMHTHVHTHRFNSLATYPQVLCKRALQKHSAVTKEPYKNTVLFQKIPIKMQCFSKRVLQGYDAFTKEPYNDTVWGGYDE